jgi:predicted secreted protein
MRPAVFLMLFLCACEDKPRDDFNRAWASYRATHVSCTDEASC